MHATDDKTVVQEAKKSVVQVTTLPITTRNNMSYDIEFPAMIEGIQNTVIQSKSAGIVTSMRAKIGDKVFVGQTLATIENPGNTTDASDAGLRSIEINQAEIRVAQAKKSYQEAKDVDDNEESHASETLKDNAKLSYESAQLELASLLDNRTIKSPVSGVVTSVRVNQNESVAEGQTLVTVGIPSSVKIAFYVSQSDISSVSVGKKIDLKDSKNANTENNINEGGQSQTRSAIITRIAPQADAQTGKFLVEAVPEKVATPSVSQSTKQSATQSATQTDQQPLVPGVATNVVIRVVETADASSMLIPLESLFVGQNNKAVFVLKKGENHVKKMPVQIVRMSGNIVSISLDGLQESDEIIVSNAHALSDGDEVIIKN